MSISSVWLSAIISVRATREASELLWKKDLSLHQIDCSSELLLEALDGLNGIFVDGVEAFRGRRISYFETLVIIGVQRVECVGVVPDNIE